MMWLIALLVVLVIGAVAVVVVGRDDEMGEVYDDRPDATIPIGRPLTADDLHQVRFSTAVRGYRMDEVDALLARVEADLLGREHAEVAGESGGEPVDEAAGQPAAEPPAGATDVDPQQP